jgi:hypothetical protein
MGFWGDLFGGDQEAKAAEANRRAAGQYQTDASGALKTSYDASTGYGQQAVGAYQPLKALGEKYAPAQDLQLDAIGANGPEGTKRAQIAMQATPGYAAGIEAVMRRRAGASMGDSGGTDQDLINYGTQSVYAPWMAGVTHAADTGGSYTGAAAGGEAAGYGNLSALAGRYGENQVGVYGNTMQTNIGANNQEAAGKAQGAKNLLGAGLALGGLVAAPFTGGASLGGSLSSLGSMFSGGGSQNANPWQFPTATGGGNWGRPAMSY